jgi:hypothetical protein
MAKIDTKIIVAIFNDDKIRLAQKWEKKFLQSSTTN